MTEQEAINILNGIEEVRGNLTEDGDEVEITLMMAKDALREIQRYRALGTVEELREATEKQVQKKGKNISKAERGFTLRFCTCPVCEKRISNIEGGNYCPNCGQAIDWSEK